MTCAEFKMCEEILALYPEICQNAEMRKCYLLNLALDRNPNEPVQGGSGLKAGEIYAEQSDHEMKIMQEIISRVDKAVSHLSEDDKEFVRIYYFFGIEDKITFQRNQRFRICNRISFPLLGAYEYVRQYRKRQREIREEVMKKWRRPPG